MAYKLYHKDADYSYVLGPFPSFECLKWRPDLVRAIFYAEKFSEKSKLLSMAQRINKPAELGTKLLEKLAHGQKDPYVAVIYNKDGLLQALASDKPHLVLHEIRNSGNLGTILRACLAFNIHDVALIGDTVSIYQPEIARASMGALFALRINTFPDLETYLKEHYSRQRSCYSFCLSSEAKPLRTVLKQRTQGATYSLFLGNEGQGLPKICEKTPFQPVIIEQSEHVDSLNLAIAASIAMYEFGND